MITIRIAIQDFPVTVTCCWPTRYSGKGKKQGKKFRKVRRAQTYPRGYDEEPARREKAGSATYQ